MGEFELRKLFLLGVLLVAGQAWATHTCGFGVGGGADAPNTCYVSPVSGSDANSGKDKANAWAHLPGMLNATANAASQVPIADDNYISKGCETFANASLPIHWSWSGSSGHPIILDRDVTWFNATNCPSGWNRVLLDAGNAVIQNLGGACHGAGLGKHWFLYIDTAQWVNFNWLQAQNLFWDTDEQGTCFRSMGYVAALSADHINFGNWYIPRWTHSSSVLTTTDSTALLQIYNAAPYCPNCFWDHLVMDNKAGDGADCGGADNTCSAGGIEGFNVTNSVIAYVAQCIGPTRLWNRPSTMEWGNINCSHVDESFKVPNQGASRPHPNAFETTGVVNGSSGQAIVYAHGLYVHDITVAEGLQVGNPNESDFVFDSLWDMHNNAAGANGPQMPQQAAASWSLYFANNTVVWDPGCAVGGGHGAAMTDLTFSNNHCIGSGAIVLGGTLTPSGLNLRQTNLGMLTSVAAGQGYVTGDQYQPILGGSTIGFGTNLTSSWPGGFSTNDSTLACTEQTMSGVVQAVCPTRPTNTRPGGGAWDAGAYEFNAGAPGFSPSPSPIAYGNVATGAHSAITEIITNVGGSSLIIGTISSSNGLFVISSDTCSGQSVEFVPCTFVLTFSPVGVGLQNATITIPDNAGNPDTLSASGTGISASATGGGSVNNASVSGAQIK